MTTPSIEQDPEELDSSVSNTLVDSEEEWIETFLSITHRETQEVGPFVLSPFQRYYLERRREKAANNQRRRVILKPRQIYASTVILAKNFYKAVTVPGTRVLTLTHNDDATELFRLTVSQWCEELKSLGMLPSTDVDNAGLLSFANLGSYMVFGTAGGKLGGRSTAFNTVHLSEIAHWTGDAGKILGGIIPSVPDEGEIDMESTPNGAEGPLYDYYTDSKAGDNEWDGIFLPWFDVPRYVREVPEGFKPTMDEVRLQAKYRLSNEQLAWRRWMKSEMRRTSKETEQGMFEQEYPEDDISCFLAGSELVLDNNALISMIDWVQQPIPEHEDLPGWQIWKAPDPQAVYVMPVDTSDGKFDYSAAHIMDARSREVVATWHGKTSPTFFAEPVYKGAVLYNHAMIVVETPGPGTVLIEKLISGYNYENMYYYHDEVTGRVNDDPGWPQNSKTRGLVIDTLQADTKRLAYRIYHDRTIRELASLTWRKLGNMRRARAEAAPGAHDDLALALGIGLCTAPEALRLARAYNNTKRRSVVSMAIRYGSDESARLNLAQRHGLEANDWDGVIWGDLPPSSASGIKGVRPEEDEQGQTTYRAVY